MRRVLSRLATGSGWVACCGAQPGHGGAGARTTEHAAPQGWRGPEIWFPAAPRGLYRRADSLFLLGGRRAGPRWQSGAVECQPRLRRYSERDTCTSRPRRILGGNYGFQVMFPWGANNRIQGTEIDANPGAGLTDSAVVPINLGWHSKRADSQFSYTIYIPTGRYSDGADDNTGLGMWGNEFGFGSTVYLNEARQYHAATTASIIFSSKKEDSNTQPGSQLGLEGGVGGDFLKGGLTFGLAYYAAIKLSDDEIDGLPGCSSEARTACLRSVPRPRWRSLARTPFMVSCVWRTISRPMRARRRRAGRCSSPARS